MKTDKKGFALGLLSLVIAVLIIGILFSKIMNMYMGKSSRQQEQVRNAFADANVSVPASATENYDGLLSSIKSRLNASTQKELDHARDLGAY